MWVVPIEDYVKAGKIVSEVREIVREKNPCKNTLGKVFVLNVETKLNMENVLIAIIQKSHNSMISTYVLLLKKAKFTNDNQRISDFN